MVLPSACCGEKYQTFPPSKFLVRGLDPRHDSITNSFVRHEQPDKGEKLASSRQLRRVELRPRPAGDVDEKPQPRLLGLQQLFFRAGAGNWHFQMCQYLTRATEEGIVLVTTSSFVAGLRRGRSKVARYSQRFKAGILSLEEIYFQWIVIFGIFTDRQHSRLRDQEVNNVAGYLPNQITGGFTVHITGTGGVHHQLRLCVRVQGGYGEPVKSAAAVRTRQDFLQQRAEVGPSLGQTWKAVAIRRVTFTSTLISLLTDASYDVLINLDGLDVQLLTDLEPLLHTATCIFLDHLSDSGHRSLLP